MINDRDPPSVREMIDEVAWWHGVTYDQVISRDRHAELVAARNDAIKRVREARPKFSLPQLGRHFQRHHSTILHSLDGDRNRAMSKLRAARRRHERHEASLTSRTKPKAT